jgi:hypothetical protein
VTITNLTPQAQGGDVSPAGQAAVNHRRFDDVSDMTALGS